MLREILSYFRQIKTYALVGESGTGKSFRAKLVAQKYHIGFIIDDGLLIHGSRIIAGHSAKEEKTFMAAVKTALFDNKARRDEIARALRGEKFNKILLLGTSEKMVNKIAARLQLPMPFRIIRIEEIASQEEIERAVRLRKIEGKHVIPVPSMEIRRSYPAIFHTAVRILRRRRITEIPWAAPEVHEKSVVRPYYSKREKIPISAEALTHMAMFCVGEYSRNLRVKKIAVKDGEAGYRLAITLDVPYGTQLEDTIAELQDYIINDIERFTLILIEEVNIIIDKIYQEEPV
jgi:ABC-type oligopeptide transport system ATPase subunit